MTLTGPWKKKVPHFLEIEVTSFKEINLQRDKAVRENEEEGRQSIKIMFSCVEANRRSDAFLFWCDQWHSTLFSYKTTEQ